MKILLTPHKEVDALCLLLQMLFHGVSWRDMTQTSGSLREDRLLFSSCKHLEQTTWVARYVPPGGRGGRALL